MAISVHSWTLSEWNRGVWTWLCFFQWPVRQPLGFSLCVFLGALELADVSAELPGLKWMPGVSQWKVNMQ